MRRININNKCHYIKENSLFKKKKKKGGESRCYRSCISSCRHSWEGGAVRERGVGGAVLLALAAAAAAAYRKFQ